MQTYGKVHIGKNLTKAPPQWWGGGKRVFFKWGVVGVSFDYYIHLEMDATNLKLSKCHCVIMKL